MSCAENDMRILLLGKTGAGKSSLGNTLIGEDVFAIPQKRIKYSGTERCSWREAQRSGFRLLVTDTPGLYDNNCGETRERIWREIAMSALVVHPGPHIILFFLRCDQPSSHEEILAYQTIKRILGEQFRLYLMVVFVGADAYGTTLEEKLAGAREAVQNDSPEEVKKILQEAGDRFCVVDNTAGREDREKQADSLVEQMKSLMRENLEEYFSNELMNKVDELLREEAGNDKEPLGSVIAAVGERGEESERLVTRAYNVIKPYILQYIQVVGPAVAQAAAVQTSSAAEELFEHFCSLM